MNTLFERNITNYKDEWLTDPAIIKALGQFDLDPCSPINRPWPTANNHFTVADNGLTKQWEGRVWMNPPYSDIDTWMKKMVYHGNGIALTFARTDTNMFYKYAWEKADSILFILQRLKFYNVDGSPAKFTAGAPSCLISYGKHNLEALEDCGIPGKHIFVNYQPVIVVGISPTWFSVVSIAVKNFGDQELQPIYDMVERMAPEKIDRNRHWKEKIRQQVQVIRKQK